MLGRYYDGKISLFVWIGIIVLVFCVFESCCATSESSSSSSIRRVDSNTSQLWKDWLYVKSGGKKGVAVWSYEGRLVDPRTGLTIAEVEGLELVRRLAEIHNHHPKNDNEHNRRVTKRWDSLAVKDMLLPDNNNNLLQRNDDWNYANTILSRKLFCYVDNDNDNNNNNNNHSKNKSSHNKTLLRKIRPFGNPSRPWIHIPSQQAVSLVDSAITYISNSIPTDDDDNKEEEWIMHTEWPDGRYVTCPTTSSSSQPSSSNKRGVGPQQMKQLQFSVQMPPTVSERKPAKLPILNHKAQKRNTPRSKFIQLGRNPTTTGSSPVLMPARETYLYQWNDDRRHDRRENSNNNNNNDDVRLSAFPPTKFIKRMKRQLFQTSNNKEDRHHPNDDSSQMTLFYTRQGEAPPWYGPGQSVILELVAKRYTSLSDAPWNTVARLAARNIPGFATVLTSLPDVTSTTTTAKDPKLDNNNNNNNNGKTASGDSNKIQIQKEEENNGDEMAARAVRWFRQGDSNNAHNNNNNNDSLKLQVLWDNEDEIFATGNDDFNSRQKVFKKMKQCIDKIVAATRVSSET